MKKKINKKIKNPLTPQSSVIGAAGEHLVLSNLLRLNFVAGQAPYNTKDYDLVVLNKNGTSSSPIQVKTALNKDGWVMKKKDETPIKNLIFCFVYLEINSSKTEIYIIDSKTVSEVLRFSHKIWLKVPGLKGRKHNDNNMRVLSRNNAVIVGKVKNFEEYLNTDEIEFLANYSEGWLNKYKDGWNLIENK